MIDKYPSSGDRSPDSRPDILLNYTHSDPGSLPGTFRLDELAQPPEINLIDYNSDYHHYGNHLTPAECVTYLSTETVSWVDVGGLGDQETLKELGEVFKLHPLILADIVNVPQRPKLEDHQDQLVVITQMVSSVSKNREVWLEQVSFILGENYLLTVQEKPQQDCFNSVRDRLSKNKGIIRQHKADYLVYVLWDKIIDSYFPVLEMYGEKIEELEELVLAQPSKVTLGKIHQIKRDLLSLRRAINPQKDMLRVLIRDGDVLIKDRTIPYLKDCHEHTIQIIDTIEIYRELASSLMDLYLSVASNKMNEVMKLLAVISTIFIPLTFIAGLYGMNFNPNASPWNMPELDWAWGYPICLATMLAIAIALSIYFWRKGWLS